MKIQFSDDAKEDVQDISDYTFYSWGEEQETVYLKSINKKLAEIALDPKRWRKRSDLFANCQTAPIGKHIIFFLVRDEEILVSRILHQSMDIPTQTFPI